MILRAILALGIVLGVAFTGETAGTMKPLSRWLPGIPSAFASEVGGLAFSEGVNEQARPVGPTTTFSSETMRIWISFNYYDFKAGDRVQYVVRANGEEWQTGDVACCEGAEGRYAFPIERERDRAFGGAGYEVVILVGNVEASRGSFQVLGTGGFDNDNCDDESQTHRGNLSSRNKDKC